MYDEEIDPIGMLLCYPPDMREYDNMEIMIDQKKRENGEREDEEAQIYEDETSIQPQKWYGYECILTPKHSRSHISRPYQSYVNFIRKFFMQFFSQIFFIATNISVNSKDYEIFEEILFSFTFYYIV